MAEVWYSSSDVYEEVNGDSREISAVFAFYVHKLYFKEIINYPIIKPVQPKNKYIDDLRQSLKMIEDEKRCQAIFDNIEFDLDN